MNVHERNFKRLRSMPLPSSDVVFRIEKVEVSDNGLGDLVKKMSNAIH
jgi:hypothetical protein